MVLDVLDGSLCVLQHLNRILLRYLFCVFYLICQLVAINYPSAEPDSMAYLFQYDTVHGKYQGDVAFDDDSIIVNGKVIKTFHR